MISLNIWVENIRMEICTNHFEYCQFSWWLGVKMSHQRDKKINQFTFWHCLDFFARWLNFTQLFYTIIVKRGEPFYWGNFFKNKLLIINCFKLSQLQILRHCFAPIIQFFFGFFSRLIKRVLKELLRDSPSHFAKTS